MYVKDVKKFIEKQRQFAQHYQKNGEGWKDVEYGRCFGKVSDVKSVLDREDVDVDPFQSGLRWCPAVVAAFVADPMEDTYMLIHGTNGCAYLQKTFLDAYVIPFREPQHLFTTGMNKIDTILGAENKLRQSILEIDRDYHPKTLVVMKTCAPSIIGDDISGVCNSLRDKVSCKLVPIDMTSLSSRHTVHGRDKLLLAMVETFVKPSKKKIPNSINLLGDTTALHPPQYRPPNDAEELARVLTDMGVTIHCRLPGLGQYESIETMSSASLNVLVCGASSLSAARYLEEHYGTPYVTVNRPIGMMNTTQMYLAVIDALGLGSEAEKVIEREIIATDKALEPYREKLRGKTYALTLASGRMVGQVLLGLELGMKPVFLGIHSLNEKLFAGLDVLSEVLAENGYEPEVIVEANYYEEAEVLTRLKPDAWFCDGTEKSLLTRYGTPYVNAMAEAFAGPTMGYRGAITWAKNAARAVESAHIFRKMGAPQLYVPKEPYSDVRETCKIGRRV